MLGKAMHVATMCILAFAILGAANSVQDASCSEGTAQDLEHRLGQDLKPWKVATLLLMASSMVHGAPHAPSAGRKGWGLNAMHGATEAHSTIAAIEADLQGWKGRGASKADKGLWGLANDAILEVKQGGTALGEEVNAAIKSEEKNFKKHVEKEKLKLEKKKKELEKGSLKFEKELEKERLEFQKKMKELEKKMKPEEWENLMKELEKKLTPKELEKERLQFENKMKVLEKKMQPKELEKERLKMEKKMKRKVLVELLARKEGRRLLRRHLIGGATLPEACAMTSKDYLDDLQSGLGF